MSGPVQNIPDHPVFSGNATAAGKYFPHFWEHTVGSGRAALALRADWQEQLARCHRELGFRHVRFHGILDDDMGTLVIEQDKPLYSFFNADKIFDFLLSIGMKPFIELSFMPMGLSSGNKTVFHYKANVTPPRDYNAWGLLISKLAQHWIERYGAQEVRQWFFEVWNEPNLEYFGTGKQSDYFKLYQVTTAALKNVDPLLRVGGPATAKNAWIGDFLQFCNNNKVHADFVSTHHYPTDSFGKPGDDTETQLAESRRSVLREQAEAVKKAAGEKHVYYTEWSSSSNPRDLLHDEPYAAAFIVKTIMEATGLVEGYSYWTFSDIFEENYFPSVPFHGGFGLLNIHGIPKPAYRAFQLLHALGDYILPLQGKHETVDAWLVRKGQDFTVLITNFVLPRHPAKEEQVEITLGNINKPNALALRRIDENHAYAKKRWQEIGKPEYLHSGEVEVLKKASELKEESWDFEWRERTLKFSLALPAQGIAAVEIKMEEP